MASRDESSGSRDESSSARDESSNKIIKLGVPFSVTCVLFWLLKPFALACESLSDCSGYFNYCGPEQLYTRIGIHYQFCQECQRQDCAYGSLAEENLWMGAKRLLIAFSVVCGWSLFKCCCSHIPKTTKLRRSVFFLCFLMVNVIGIAFIQTLVQGDHKAAAANLVVYGIVTDQLFVFAKERLEFHEENSSRGEGGQHLALIGFGLAVYAAVVSFIGFMAEMSPFLVIPLVYFQREHVQEVLHQPGVQNEVNKRRELGYRHLSFLGLLVWTGIVFYFNVVQGQGFHYELYIYLSPFILTFPRIVSGVLKFWRNLKQLEMRSSILGTSSLVFYAINWGVMIFVLVYYLAKGEQENSLSALGFLYLLLKELKDALYRLIAAPNFPHDYYKWLFIFISLLILFTLTVLSLKVPQYFAQFYEASLFILIVLECLTYEHRFRHDWSNFQRVNAIGWILGLAAFIIAQTWLSTVDARIVLGMSFWIGLPRLDNLLFEGILIKQQIMQPDDTQAINVEGSNPNDDVQRFSQQMTIEQKESTNDNDGQFTSGKIVELSKNNMPSEEYREKYEKDMHITS